MRKLFALLLCATFIFGEIAVFQLKAIARANADARAEELLRAARTAIGGEAAINAVNNLLIAGRVTHSVKLPDNQERQFEGNLEMALELPDKLHKKMTLGDAAGAGIPEGAKRIRVDRADVLVRREMKDGEAPSPEKIQKRFAGGHGDELSRLLFGLLLKTSPALDAVYSFLGEGNVDGTAANIVEARSGEGFAVKLYLDKQTNLPLMISYRSAEPQHRIFIHKEGGEPAANAEVLHDIIVRRGELPEGAKVIENGEGAKVIIRKKDENGNVTTTTGDAKPFEIRLEEADFQIKFSDYRSVNGVMLPHTWTKTVNGANAETININSYEVNAPNLAEKFKNEREPRVMFKTKQN